MTETIILIASGGLGYGGCMHLAFGDLWSYPADAVGFTTNGTVRHDGQLVMGRGTALQARQRYPALPRTLGFAVRLAGNHVIYLGRFYGTDGINRRLVSFPVKHQVSDATADLDLIRASSQELMALVEERSWARVVLPRPGCGAGRLPWSLIAPVVEALFDDRVHVIDQVPDP